MKALLVSPNPETRELMSLAVRGISRRLGGSLELFEAVNGERALDVGWRERPEIIVADEFASRAGAFAMARDLRGAPDPFGGAIVILLDRHQDAWLARWSGADAWFVKPFDPFVLAERVVELLHAKAKEPA